MGRDHDKRKIQQPVPAVGRRSIMLLVLMMLICDPRLPPFSLQTFVLQVLRA